MKRVQHMIIEGVTLDYYIDDYVYIYNSKNDKMIQADNNTLEYLKNYDSHKSEKVDGLENFLFGRKKLDLLNFKILNLKLNTKGFEKLFIIENNLIIKILFFVLISFFLLTLPMIFKNTISLYQSGAFHFKLHHLLYIYLAQFSIIMLHEFGHFYSYRKYIVTDTMRFGVMIRYFFMLLFYNNVNYMRTLKKKDKLVIMFSGVTAQMLIGGLLAALCIFYNNNIILYIYFVNLIILSTNMLPFLKLDGYWIINLLINSEDYMKSFKNFIFFRKKARVIEILLGSINVIIIIFILISGLNFLFKQVGDLI
ncbi:M50 family metallopeptidase [Priestia megaterium]|uniref:M50 family metallopeptidase n=1 Tax=Priestia megaterium TaxID=1404 RepID=UPI00159C61FA|nr:M50 family metallopeptidase [Priestia megaterium]